MQSWSFCNKEKIGFGVIRLCITLIFILPTLSYSADWKDSVITQDNYKAAIRSYLPYIVKRFDHSESYSYKTDVLRSIVQVDTNGQATNWFTVKDFSGHDGRQLRNMFRIIEFPKALKDSVPVDYYLRLSFDLYAYTMRFTCDSMLYHVNARDSIWPIRDTIPYKRAEILINDKINDSLQLELGKILSRQSSSFFIKKMESRNQMGRVRCRVKHLYEDSYELCWLSVVNIENFRVNGKFEAKPKVLEMFDQGDEYVVDIREIYDWQLLGKRPIGYFGDPEARYNTLNLEIKDINEIIHDLIFSEKVADIERRIIGIDTTEIDVKTAYPGGTDALKVLFRDNLVKFLTSNEIMSRQQQRNTSLKRIDRFGTVYASFYITSEGKILNPKILLGGSHDDRESLIRSIYNMEPWQPALSNGKAVPSYRLIKFDLNWITTKL